MTPEQSEYFRKYRSRETEAVTTRNACDYCGYRVRTAEGKQKHIRAKHPEQWEELKKAA